VELLDLALSGQGDGELDQSSDETSVDLLGPLRRRMAAASNIASIDLAAPA